MFRVVFKHNNYAIIDILVYEKFNILHNMRIW